MSVKLQSISLKGVAMTKGVFITNSFTKGIISAIRHYRQLLRRYLSQAERIKKLNDLHLKNNKLYENEVKLYETAYLIVEDIKNNFITQEKNAYYAYSGIQKFGQHLEKFLMQYEIIHDYVVHRSQRASQALLKAIQLLTLTDQQISEQTQHLLSECNKVIAQYGTEEQKQLHKNTLTHALNLKQTPLLHGMCQHFENQMNQGIF